MANRHDGWTIGDQKVLLTIVEVSNHYCVIVFLDSKKAESVNKALTEIFSKENGKGNNLFKTIVSDNGSEFAGLKDLPFLEDKVYFAHPGTPTDKPHIERKNEYIRRFIKKGESMDNLTQEEVKTWMDDLNSKSLKSNNWATPTEVMCAQIRKYHLEILEEANKTNQEE